MANTMFQKATKKGSKLRLALIGVSGSGKSYSGLQIASNLGKRIAVMDTERGSISKYSDIFDFDVIEPENFAPKTYIEAIEAAEEGGYDVLLIDSLSHAWMGAGGALEQVDNAGRRNQGGGGNFGAWRDVTPQHNAMIEAIIGAKIHIIATMRAKTEYVQEKDKNGRTTIRKVGLAPVQRDGLEYEFDVVSEIDSENNMIIGKTRCPAIAGQTFRHDGKKVAKILLDWLGDAPAAPKTFEAQNASTSDDPNEYDNAADDYDTLSNRAGELGVTDKKGNPFPARGRWPLAALQNAVRVCRECLDERVVEDKANADAERMRANDPTQADVEEGDNKVSSIPLILKPQLDAIYLIADKLFKDRREEGTAAMIKEAGKPLEELNTREASALIERLRAKLPETASHARSKASDKAESETQAAKAPEMITAPQKTAIHTLAGKIWGAETSRAELGKLFTGSTTDLTKAHAMEIIDALQKKLKENGEFVEPVEEDEGDALSQLEAVAETQDELPEHVSDFLDFLADKINGGEPVSLENSVVVERINDQFKAGNKGHAVTSLAQLTLADVTMLKRAIRNRALVIQL